VGIRWKKEKTPGDPEKRMGLNRGKKDRKSNYGRRHQSGGEKQRFKKIRKGI